MEALNKDVVGARLNLDITKMAPAFKVIDGGARKNAESFKVLNAELAHTEKNYVSLAKAADKMAMNADERRKKMIAESNALVAQRNAQAELLKAKTESLNKTNAIVDEKLKAQETLVRRRNEAIEQQEREHQKRMDALQSKANAAGARDNALQARLDREYQQMRNGQTRIEQQTAEHQARMNRLNQSSSPIDTSSYQNSSGMLDKIKNAALHATVFQGIYSSIHVAQEALREGLVGIEANMAGYVQTNEKYFVSFAEGTHEMIMNTERLSQQTTQFIHTAHALGAEIMDVTESARLWGRMYKDVEVVQELVRQSTMLSTVDLVSLESATKSMESVMSQYAVQIENSNDAMVIGNRVLDSWSRVAHDTMAPARDLGAAFERTGKIADETGVSFDFMNGLISSGIRNTALSGENLGNMWKTVLGTIRTDKAVSEIESLGVATKVVVDGMEEWRKAEDILLDLSIAVTDKNYDLTQSYAAISRGVYQFAKLAASLNAGDILLGTAASIGSTGMTLEYLQVQMDTIQRKAQQAKTSLLEIFNQAGDDGLRSAIKDSLDIIDQLLIGITKIPKGVFAATASIAGLIAVYKLIAPLYAQYRAAQVALNTAIEMHIALNTAATGQMVAFTAAARASMLVTAAWTAGITLAVGLIAAYVMSLGAAEKKQREHIQSMKDESSASQQLVSQYERQIEFLPKLVQAQRSYQELLDSGTLSSEKSVKVKKQLDEVSKAFTITLGEEGAAQLKAAGYTDEAVALQVAAMNDLVAAQKEAQNVVLNDQRNETVELQIKKQTELEKATKRLSDVEKKLAESRSMSDKQRYSDQLEAAKLKVSGLTEANNKLKESLSDLNVQLGHMAIDQLAGSNGKLTQSEDEAREAAEKFKEQIEGNNTAINELNNVLKELTSGQAMNAESAVDLILQYPELTDRIYKAADGWMFEKDAVEVLRKEKIQKAIDDLKSEKSSAANTMLATQDRLKAYGVEMQGIRDLATLKAKLNGANQKREELEKVASMPTTPLFGDYGSFNPSNILQQNAKKQIAEEDAALAEINSYYDEYFKTLSTYDDKIKVLSDLYNDPNFGIQPDKGKNEKKEKKTSK